MDALKPLSTIGILGGGQLGRMLALAASNLGFRVHIYAPEADSPAYDVTRFFTCAAYDDQTALAEFAATCDVITFEFENIPLSTIEFLETLAPVHPNSAALRVAQDRLNEKNFAQQHGLNVGAFAAISHPSDFAPALQAIGAPAVLKTVRMGYDGKGQQIIRSADDAPAAWAHLGNVACIYEQFINFEAEVSIIAARGHNGSVAIYDLVENIHEHHILARSIVPTHYGAELHAQAAGYATRVLEQLNYVGVLAIEFFVVRTADDTLNLYFNEMAPRVHNSAHWTQLATHTCQFEQHIRAVAGWPLGATTRFAPVELRNILGDDIENFATDAAAPNAKLVLYGKSDVKAGRKMGHVVMVK